MERQAELNLSYTTIVAPIDGVVGNRTLRVGQFVQAGTQLMSLVPTPAPMWSRTSRKRSSPMCAGPAVDIDVDMFPGTVVHGHVDSLAPASGQEFALLPPDNATGNFTKVVQRIPVKIALDGDRDTSTLRPGMSVIPSIQTKTRRASRRAASHAERRMAQLQRGDAMSDLALSAPHRRRARATATLPPPTEPRQPHRVDRHHRRP